ncbi:MAG: hypothetical protein M3P93_02035, partial [Actinomycetota bacterium]|nr:hypothetical protein [Actinomycetota bacterium]
TTPAPAAPPAVTVDPPSGPAGQRLTVTGTGWTPGTEVTVSYLAEDRPAGAQAVARVDPQGGFTVVLAADDPDDLPGPHSVSATDGTTTVAAAYDVQP